MSLKIPAIILLLALHSVVVHGNESSPSPSDFIVIVNSDNPIDALDRKLLADMFFKKVTRWPEDGIVQPVDLRPDAPARRKFSEVILNRSVMGVKNYWQQLIFSGRDVPPPELKNDAEVVQYVSRNSGAIGYVSASLDPSGVKTVTIK